MAAPHPYRKNFRIVFGSCQDQKQPLPILDTIVARRPDLFIYLGDNIYCDTRDPDTLRAAYERLAGRREFQRLRAACPVVATWDDHDYGMNDAGRHHPLKKESRELFLDFWQEPPDGPRREHEGVYHSFFTGPEACIQVILLDLRTFRDDLLPNDGLRGHVNDYRPWTDNDSTLLGASQWHWLGEQLRLPARVRVIASSIQFAHAYNGYESWNNFPHEQERLMQLIRTTRAAGVVMISGDRHWGELSERTAGAPYAIYDLTSSGLTQEWKSVMPNERRIGEPVRENNFGMLDLAFEGERAHISMALVDGGGEERMRWTFPLSDLSPWRAGSVGPAQASGPSERARPE